jgi:PAS domain S-box-containing protein
VFAPLPDGAGEYEAVLQFLYLAPVGLVQASPDGEIVMINPISAQLLMPLSADGNLTNLFTALESVAPDLRQRAASFGPTHGLVCDALRIQLRAGVRGKTDPQMLSLSLLKLDGDRMMAVLSDITAQVAQERLLRQNDAWLNAILAGVTDYALLRLDRDGCIDDWNPSIGRVTGFGRDAVMGRPFSIFYPGGGSTPERVRDRLSEADESGWSLDEGWRLKADGSRFWGSAMISPLREPNARPPASAGEPAYSLVIRNIDDPREASARQRRDTLRDPLGKLAETGPAQVRRADRAD